MTKPAAIREADIARAARVAKRENVAIEISAGGHVVRIIPDTHKPEPLPRHGKHASLSDWMEAKDADKACGYPHR